MTLYFQNKDNYKDLITNVLDTNAHKKDEDAIFKKIERNASFGGTYNSTRVKTPNATSRRRNLLDFGTE